MFHENMSRVCDICGRGTGSGNSRSHSNISTRRKFAINLQSKSIDGQTVKICTKCLKTKVKPKRVKKAKPARPGKAE
jgi:large subunit ribosomal protein L28